jgi:hypothetical protein
MEPIQEIEVRRQGILKEMSDIRVVMRGTFKEQMMPVRLRDQKEPVLRGPYYLLAIWKDGKTHSRRIRSEEAPLAREGAANYRRIKELCEEFAVLTERLGELERARDSQEAQKKGLKSRRNATRR